MRRRSSWRRSRTKKGKGKTLKYLVKWEGYREETWEPKAFLANNEVLAEWLAAQKK